MSKNNMNFYIFEQQITDWVQSNEKQFTTKIEMINSFNRDDEQAMLSYDIICSCYAIWYLLEAAKQIDMQILTEEVLKKAEELSQESEIYDNLRLKMHSIISSYEYVSLKHIWQNVAEYMYCSNVLTDGFIKDVKEIVKHLIDDAKHRNVIEIDLNTLQPLILFGAENNISIKNVKKCFAAAYLEQCAYDKVFSDEIYGNLRKIIPLCGFGCGIHKALDDFAVHWLDEVIPDLRELMFTNSPYDDDDQSQIVFAAKKYQVPVGQRPFPFVARKNEEKIDLTKYEEFVAKYCNMLFDASMKQSQETISTDSRENLSIEMIASVKKFIKDAKLLEDDKLFDFLRGRAEFGDEEAIIVYEYMFLEDLLPFKELYSRDGEWLRQYLEDNYRDVLGNTAYMVKVYNDYICVQPMDH